MLRFVQTALVLMVMSHQTVLGQLNLVTFANQVLAQHNFRRAQHCTPLVALNATLTAMAQNRSNINAANNAMAFSGGVGENLYKMMSSAPFTVINGSVPVEAFYQGISNYSFSAPGITRGSGQFSQMIWKASTQIGVGIAFTNGNKTAYITINYWTPGNYANQFAANVLPVCAGGTTAAPAPTTTAAPTTTIAPTAALIAFQNQALVHHNFLRAKHCTAALTLVASLNTMAQNYANYLAANNLFQHGNASSLGYGENLWKAWQSVPFVSVNGSIPSQAWYDEIQLYNYATPSFNASTGHFTQLVWASTTQVGFGLAYSADKLTAVAVANYYSHGNVGGQFPANVKVLC